MINKAKGSHCVIYVFEIFPFFVHGLSCKCLFLGKFLFRLYYHLFYDCVFLSTFWSFGNKRKNIKTAICKWEYEHRFYFRISISKWWAELTQILFQLFLMQTIAKETIQTAYWLKNDTEHEIKKNNIKKKSIWKMFSWRVQYHLQKSSTIFHFEVISVWIKEGENKVA